MADDHSVETENRFVRVFGTIGDLFALNLLWLLASLPIVTIGASTTALYTVTLRMVYNEEGNLWKSFWKAFAKNFKKATIIWLIMLFAAAVIYAEMFYGFNMEGILPKIYLVLMAVELVIFALTVPFVFPLTARYENTIWNTFKNSFLLAISNLGAWIKVFLIWFTPIFFCVRYPGIFFLIWYLWFMFVFALMAWGSSWCIKKMFTKISAVKEKEEADKDVEKTFLGRVGLRNDRERMEKKQEYRRTHSIAERAHKDTRSDSTKREVIEDAKSDATKREVTEDNQSDSTK